MGHQFSIVLGPEDQVAFDSVLKSSGEVAILSSRSLSPKAEPLLTTAISAMGEEPLRVLLAQPEDVDAIVFQPTANGGEYFCSSLTAPVIEFDRCFVSGEVIRPGRLYYVSSYFDEDGQRVAKSSAFLDWAKALFKRSKASLKLVENDYYAGKDALRLLNTIPLSRT